MHALFGLLALSWVPYQTETGIPLHWPAWASPPVRVAPAPPDGLAEGAVLGLVASALDAWLEAPCPTDATHVDVRPDIGAPTLGGAALIPDDGTISVVWFDDAAAWNARFGQLELARTILMNKRSTGEIVDADVAVNFGGFAFTTSATCLADHYDLASTLTHEVGHVMGLDHSAVPTATMTPRTDPGVCDLRDLDDDDVAGLCATYVMEIPPQPEPGPEPAAEPVAEAGDVTPGTHGGEDGCAAGGLGSVLGAIAIALHRRAARAA